MPSEDSSAGPAAGDLVRAQAAELRGVDIGEQRAREIAADIGKINEAVAGARDRLDFNDEPARFVALLGAPVPKTAKARRKK